MKTQQMTSKELKTPITLDEFRLTKGSATVICNGTNFEIYPHTTPNAKTMTLESLDIALKICSIQIDMNILKRVIDIVTLLKDKPDASLNDLILLRKDWNNEIKYTAK